MAQRFHCCFIVILMAAALLLTACLEEDKLPLPWVKSEITTFEVEGQCDAAGDGFAEAQIDKEKREVTLYVSDQVSLSKVKLKKFVVSNNAFVYKEMADGGLVEVTHTLPNLDCSTGSARLLLKTYQEFWWKVSVQRVVQREVVVSNQVGDAIIDAASQTVVVYVTPEQDLKRVVIEKFTLGGQHGRVYPDPTGTEVDFSRGRTYAVFEYGSETAQEWSVFVYNASSTTSTTAEVFPHSVRAYVSGNMQNGTIPVVEYCEAGSGNWQVVPGEKVTVRTTSYEAVIEGLTPGKDYECRATADGVASQVASFHTADPAQLPNSSFDDWSTIDVNGRDLYQPWKAGDSPFWDTGNRGATTVGASNSTMGVEGSRTFANLQSKYIVIKFAAGNIFTGKYLETDGTNGVLSFGQPFASFPTKLQLDYSFKTSTINKGGGKWDDSYGKYISRATYDGLLGQPDSCNVYVALIGDKDEEVYKDVLYPFIVRTRPSTLKLFSPNSDNVIAFGSMTKGDDVPEWTTTTIPLQYRFTNRQPKYIVIVAASSKYGDYFVGGSETLLKIDNLKLLYE